MNKYVALALTISFAIPLGLYLPLPANTWLVRFFPSIHAHVLFYEISWFTLALFADFIVSVVLLLLVTGKPVHPGYVILLSLIMVGMAWSISLYSFYDARFGTLDLIMLVFVGVVLFSSALKVVEKARKVSSP